MYQVYHTPRPTLPQLQIRSNSAVAYSLPLEQTPYNRKANINAPTYSGKVTDHAAKRIKRTCEILLMRSPPRTVWNTVTNFPCQFRLTFATITISATTIIDHREAYERGLKPLLRWLRDKQGWKDYLWKAELQTRGQIHWHVTGNQFLDWRHLKSQWNNIQYQRGWLDEYHGKTGLWTPNSTDIHAVGNVKRLDLYLAKYISKTGGQINGKVWDCSETLRGKKFFTFEPNYDTQDLIDEKTKRGEIRRIALENCSILEMKNPEKLIPQNELGNWASWKI